MRDRKLQNYNRFGEMLLHSGFICDDELENALFEQGVATSWRKLGEILITKGVVSETQVAHALSEKLHIPYVDLITSPVDRDAVRLIPEEEAKQHLLFAYKRQENKLYVATDDPITVNYAMFEELAANTGMEIYLHLSTKTDILEAIERYYREEEAENAAEREGRTSALDKVDKMITTLITAAYRDGVPVIYFEPTKDKTKIWFKINGEFVEQMALYGVLNDSILESLKTLSKINTASMVVPLDGQFSKEKVSLGIKVSSVAAVFGINLVIRLIPTVKEKVQKSANYDEAFDKDFEEMFNS